MKDNFFVFWIKLLWLFIKRMKNKNEYFAFQKYQAERLINNIKNEFKLIYDLDVYDYGCGNGGYSIVLAENFRDVISIDFYAEINTDKFANLNNIKFRNENLLSFKGEKRDFVFCASVIEHIPKNEQNKFIENLNRNIKDNGFLYLSFPPFYSLNGGHLAKPFHYLPEKVALMFVNIFNKKKIDSYEKMYGTWGLYKTSIQEVDEMLRNNGFDVLKIESRFMPRWFIKIFKKNNFFNWHVEFFCKKIKEIENE